MMAAMTLSGLQPLLGGERRGDARFNRVSTDSRALAAGDLFIALSGEHFDGNRFVADAKAKGAVAAIISQPTQVDLPVLRVPDCQLALAQIAAENRRRFKGAVIGITGSAGKTSCKTMTASILSQRGPVLATEGNYNNEIGVPLTLLQLAPEHRYAVVEMGAGKPGDIAYLCRFAQPDISVITNALPAHLERLGDLDTVASTKGAIYAGLDQDGSGVINLDDKYAGQWSATLGSRRRVSFSLENPAADFRASDIRGSGDRQQFTLHTPMGAVAVDLPLPGRHAVSNALAAAAAAWLAGASADDIAAGLAACKPLAGRLRRLQGSDDRVVIDDSYNANPGSVRAAIDVLASYPGKRALILGQMAELGGDAARWHGEIGAYARDAGVDRLLAVGPDAAATASAFGEGGQAFGDRPALLAALDAALAGIDTVLIKGSRSAGMEAVVQALVPNAAAGEGH